MSVGEVEKALKVSRLGLSEEEVKSRRKRYGLNILPKPKPLSGFVLFISQFKSALVYILIAAAAISAIIDHMVDFYVIIAAVLVNVVVGFFQEYKAQQALVKLRDYTTEKTTVIRDGKKYEIETGKLVPGDRIFLMPGDKVPADVRLTKTIGLKINEATLTGESKPRKKIVSAIKGNRAVADRDNLAFKGTSIIEGVGEGIVIRTGIKTKFGEIASMLKDVKEESTPLQSELGRFSRWLGIFVIILATAMIVFGVVVGRPFFDMFILAIALAVSAIPEGLIIGVTAILAVGMKRILEQKALTKKLVAAETLGSTTMICADKTGTLTTGEMEVTKVVTSPNQGLSGVKKMDGDRGVFEVLGAGVLASDAYIANPKEKLKKFKVLGNTTERPIVLIAAELGIMRENLKKGLKEVFEIPFDSAHKYMVKVYKGKDGYKAFAKGAPEKLIEECGSYLDGEKSKTLDKKLKEKIKETYRGMMKQGLRVLCVVKCEDCDIPIEKKKSPRPPFKKSAVFLGLLGIKDPLRPKVKEVVKETLSAGLKTVIITGDNRATATTIAREAGLKIKEREVMNGGEVDDLSDDALQKAAKKIKLYARVEPKHKMRIVDALQKNGEVVAMTGDGLNDAPALKSSDIGIAVASGSEVTKDVADMVLLDNNLGVIVGAIREGRGIFENIRKMILYLLSDSGTEIILVVASFVMGLPLPVLAVQILWVNLIDDSLPSLALTLDPYESGLMKRPPRPQKEKILNRPMAILILIISIVTGFTILFTFLIVLKTTGDLERARTMAFVLLGFDSLLYVFSVRSLRHSIFKNKLFNNRALILAVLIGFGLQLSVVYIPFLQGPLGTKAISINDLALVIVIAFGVLFVIEFFKLIILRRGEASKKENNPSLC